jgi:hypothetical protein
MGRGRGSIEGVAQQRCPRRGPRGPYKWTEQRTRSELEQLLARTGGRLPSAQDLERQGLWGLRNAMRRRGVGYWAQELGLELRPGQDRRPYGLEQALADMRSVVCTQQEIVGWDRLRALGFSRLASYLRRQPISSVDFCRAHGITVPGTGSGPTGKLERSG